MWFSTLGGVSCYDGETFTNYTQEDGLASDQVFRVFEDSLGYMWFATWAGINRYDGEVFQTLNRHDGLADVLTRGIGKIRETLDQGTELAEIKTNRSFDQVVQLLDNSIGATTTAIDRISQIVDSLKNFTRLDQADYQLADVHEGIESTLTLLEHQFKGRIEVSRHYGELPSIYCYPGELNQVFMNVLMNAVQAIVDAGSIRVKTYADAADVYVEVADSGRGIPKDRLQHIFEPNFAQKDARVGLSLGLATSYNIVRKHQGFLRLESEIDKGTIVTIVLPIKSN
jgi:signal transduction histidine kinase